MYLEYLTEDTFQSIFPNPGKTVEVKIAHDKDLKGPSFLRAACQ